MKILTVMFLLGYYNSGTIPIHVFAWISHTQTSFRITTTTSTQMKVPPHTHKSLREERKSNPMHLYGFRFLDDFHDWWKKDIWIHSRRETDTPKTLTETTMMTTERRTKNDMNPEFTMKNDIFIKESDLQKEIQKRKNQSSTTTSTITSTITTSSSRDENKNRILSQDFDGYALRDVIYTKWGYCYDLDFQKVETLGFRNVYLNVMPFKLGDRRFRHRTEMDYLMHLQAIVEILEKYEQLDYVLFQIEDTNKRPRGNTSPLVAVPLRLDLTEDELDSILRG